MKTNRLDGATILTAIVYLVAAAAFAVQLGGIDPRGMIVPLICIATIVLCAVAAVAFRGGDKVSLATSRTELVAALATIVYIGLIFIVGFYAASFAYTLFLVVYLSGLSVRSLMIALLYAIFINLIVYVTFSRLLEYFVPQGMIFESF